MIKKDKGRYRKKKEETRIDWKREDDRGRVRNKESEKVRAKKKRIK